MAPSANPRQLVLLLLVAALPLIGGCDSTFQQNARAKLAAARRIAAKESHTVGRRGPDVRVDRLTLLRGADATAVVVDVHSTAMAFARISALRTATCRTSPARILVARQTA